MAGGDQQHLQSFLDMLASERGAAANTLQASRRDLEDFASSLAGKNLSLVQAEAAVPGRQ